MSTALLPPRRAFKCADCGGDLRYCNASTSFGKMSGFACDVCQTVTERFGTLDVVQPLLPISVGA